MSQKKSCCNSNQAKACKVAKYLNIVGKPGEEFPNVKKSCQGQIWISADYQSGFIFDNLKWHVVDPKPTCNKVLPFG